MCSDMLFIIAPHTCMLVNLLLILFSWLLSGFQTAVIKVGRKCMYVNISGNFTDLENIIQTLEVRNSTFITSTIDLLV